MSRVVPPRVGGGDPLPSVAGLGGRASDHELVSAWFVLALLAALTLARFAVNAVLDPLPLAGDEAQYWLYGEHLAGGYYSKPPLLPWLMRLTTELFGPSHWAMRLPSIILHPLIALALFWLGRALFDRTTGIVAALIYLTVPGVTVSSMVASTDPPMMLGWALASVALVYALRTGSLVSWALAGAAFGFGLLGKYTMLAWLGGASLLILLDPHWRRGWRPRGLAVATLAAVIVASPNLLWNAVSGFPTFRHLSENADLAAKDANVPVVERLEEVADFVVSQAGVFGPIAFMILLWLIVRPASWRDPNYRLLFALGLPLLLTICAQAWLNRANANWAAPAYLTFSVAVAAWLVHSGRRRLTLLKTGLNLAVFVVVVLVATAYREEPSPWSKDYDPFRKLRGVDQITADAGSVLAEHPDAWLLMTDRMLMANVLEATGWPLERAVMWNPDRRINDHFEMVTTFPDHPDASFIVVVRGSEPPPLLERFRTHRTVLAATAKTHNDRALAFRVHVASGFEGYTQTERADDTQPGSQLSVRPSNR